MNSWISGKWKELSINNIRKSINAVRFSANCFEWYFSKHDVYGKLFNEKYLLMRSSNLIMESIDISEESDLFELNDQ